MSAWRSFTSDPPPQDGRKIWVWAKLTSDEYDEDDRVIARGNVSYYPTIIYSCPPFEGWLEHGNKIVQNAEYLYWQDIVPPAGFK